MANLCLAALERLRLHLVAPDGLNARLHALAVRDMVREPEIREGHVVIRRIPPNLADLGANSRYPAVYLWCEKLENRLERKFTSFSGRVTLAAEARVSSETIEGLGNSAARMAEALADVLAAHHGSWTEELAFDGRYDAVFGPVERGGLNYLQTARLEIELLGHA